MTYEEIGKEIGKLVDEKNKAYGSSFQKSGQIMRVLYPNGVPTEKMDDALAIVRILDKIFRIATDRDALGESPYRDIAGYALLGAVRVEREKDKPRGVPCARGAGREFWSKITNGLIAIEACVQCGVTNAEVNDEGWCRRCFAADTERRAVDRAQVLGPRTP